ncbi:DUF6464 family protein [Prochlorococcus sp. MIT 1300]|uniref:DUF6464 family protein n=1 Tax=Prochlorococcus sp. MIT 1300 TaxID=3096218 RepID=UPI002A75547C|nr:DUF6464 family protein [Prochlorococcus sp. MIT 1300]
MKTRKLLYLVNSSSEVLIDKIFLENTPYPGCWIQNNGKSYLILEQRHLYTLLNGKYTLSTVKLLVKEQSVPKDATLYDDYWVIGNPDCKYNARSPLLRCAINPQGDCNACAHLLLR